MKKILKGIATTGLVIAVWGTISFSSNAAHGCYAHRDSCHIVDIDGNDVCHNYSFGNHKAGNGHCSGYLDADGNGICDNCNSGSHMAAASH